MNYYIKLIVLVIFATLTISTSAQTPLFSTETPETWPNEMPINKKKTNKIATQKYQPSSLESGRTYNTITIKNIQQTQTATTLQNNNGSSYYRSYGINENKIQNVVYNTPIEVSNTQPSTTEQPPFAELSSNGMTRVSREDLPDDPTVPLGDGIWEMTLIALIWMIIIRYKKCVSGSKGDE